MLVFLLKQIFLSVRIFKVRVDSPANFAVNLISILYFETLLKHLIILNFVHLYCSI